MFHFFTTSLNIREISFRYYLNRFHAKNTSNHGIVKALNMFTHNDADFIMNLENVKNIKCGVTSIMMNRMNNASFKHVLLKAIL